jgi:undecaprenyl-diphosphatase
MIEFIQHVDVILFYFFNTTLQNPFFDWFMPFVTEKTHWFPVWAVIVGLLLWKGEKKGRIAVILIIPLIFMSDQFSAHVLKPWIARTRPCVALTDVHLLIKLTKSYSFPSAHASNFFALATFFSFFYPRYKWWYFTVALIVGMSRVFVGVHYPFDVLGGAILGSACAVFVVQMWRFGENLYLRRIKQTTSDSI